LRREEMSNRFRSDPAEFHLKLFHAELKAIIVLRAGVASEKRIL